MCRGRSKLRLRNRSCNCVFKSNKRFGDIQPYRMELRRERKAERRVPSPLHSNLEMYLRTLDIQFYREDYKSQQT
jgi:hypothetical protein